jgi:hypothetical protein
MARMCRGSQDKSETPGGDRKAGLPMLIMGSSSELTDSSAFGVLRCAALRCCANHRTAPHGRLGGTPESFCCAAGRAAQVHE